MKRFWKIVLVLLGLSVVLSFSNVISATTTLTAEEVKDLLYMREEEKLARDVYITLYNMYKIPIFNNISKSEERHMSAVKTLLDKYQLEDPVTDDSVGKFSNPKFTELYNTLVERGKKSVVEALTVGAFIEDLDIKDLQDAISRTNKSDIKIVYENLMNGSKNHIRSFIGQLQRYGQTYTPTYITQEELKEILSSR